jgi:hypothetical protein
LNENDEQELSVYYVLARTGDGLLTDLGLPAYDVSPKFLGFYRHLDEFGITVPVFVAAKTVTVLNETLLDQLVHLLEGSMQSNDPAIHCIMKYAGIKEMANEAIIYDMMYGFGALDNDQPLL